MTRWERLRFWWLGRRLAWQPVACAYVHCNKPLPSLPFERRYCSEDCGADAWWESIA